jgi:hypothetical protein
LGITPLDSSLAGNNELGLLGWVQNEKDARNHKPYQQLKIAINLKLGLQKELGLWDGFRLGKMRKEQNGLADAIKTGWKRKK